MSQFIKYLPVCSEAFSNPLICKFLCISYDKNWTIQNYYCIWSLLLQAQVSFILFIVIIESYMTPGVFGYFFGEHIKCLRLGSFLEYDACSVSRDSWSHREMCTTCTSLMKSEMRLSSFQSLCRREEWWCAGLWVHFYLNK